MPLMTQLDLTYEPRMWRCGECRWILGVVMRDTKRIRRLWIFRVDRTDETLPSIEALRMPERGLYKVHGANSCDGVECGHCGALNEWTINKESFDALMALYPRKPL